MTQQKKTDVTEQHIYDAKNVAGKDVHNHYYQRDLTVAEQQALFYRTTGISCSLPEKIELEKLMTDYNFTAKELMITRQAKLLVFDESSRELRLKYSSVTKYFMYVLFAMVAFLIAWSGSEIMTIYKIHLFPDNLIVIASLVGYGGLVYLFGRYGIWPFHPIQRLKSALHQMY
jgi:hypothetical protein